MNRYFEVIASSEGTSPIVLYRSTQKTGADIYRKLIGNRSYMGQPVTHREVVCSESKRIGILEKFNF